MKTHLIFLNVGPIEKRKTKIFHVVSSYDKTFLGKISWYNSWRAYVFEPTTTTKIIFSMECLDELSDFIKNLINEKLKEKQYKKWVDHFK